MGNNGKWGTAQDAQLIQLRSESKKPREIASIMNRSVKTIYYKDELMNRQKIKSAQYKKRLCLGGCNKRFLSSGPGNRICPTCSKRERTDVGSPVSLHVNRSL